MIAYDRLDELQHGLRHGSSERKLIDTVIPYLTDCWLREYERHSQLDGVIETLAERFHFLFDVSAQRLLAAWGISHGKHVGKRPTSRMSGHPLSDGPAFHRGHTIPHTLGGGTDINLVPQRGSLNVGRFRELEKAAVATPGSLYFTYWIYAGPRSQRPSHVHQGLLVPGELARIYRFCN